MITETNVNDTLVVFQSKRHVNYKRTLSTLLPKQKDRLYGLYDYLKNERCAYCPKEQNTRKIQMNREDWVRIEQRLNKYKEFYERIVLFIQTVPQKGNLFAEPKVALSEIVFQRIVDLGRAKNNDNILKFGYSMPRRNDLHYGNTLHPQLIKLYTNSSEELLKKKEWVHLHKTIGDTAMWDLLCQSIFLGFSNENILQITGDKLNNFLKRNPIEPFFSLGKRKIFTIANLTKQKRRKVSEDTTDKKQNSKDIQKKRNEPVISEKLMDKSVQKSTENSKIISLVDSNVEMDLQNPKGSFHVGDHNQITVPDHSTRKEKNVGKFARIAGARKRIYKNREVLYCKQSKLKYGFSPRHPLHSESGEALYQLIFLSKPRKGFKHIIPMLQNIIKRLERRHQEFSLLRKTYFDLEVAPSEPFQEDTQLHTQPDQEKILNKQKNPAQHRTEYSTFIVSHRTPLAVAQYIYGIIRKIIPFEFFGSKENQYCFREKIKELLGYSLWDNYNESDLLKNIKTTHIAWAYKNGKLPLKPNVQQDQAARFRIQNFFRFLFKDIVMEIRKTHFYCTESNDLRQTIFYYSHDIWDAIERISYGKLTSGEGIFIEIEKPENPMFPLGTIRLLPKCDKIRPIVNLSKPYPFPKEKISCNVLLKPLLQILKYENSLNPELIGSSVFSPSQAYQRILPFIRQVRSMKPSTRLYCVAVDVTGCYDSIPQDKVLNILKEKVLKHRDYEMIKYILLRDSLGKVRHLYPFKVIDPTEDILESLKQEEIKNSVFIDRIKRELYTREEVIEQLEYFLKKSVIKVSNNKFILQKIGIPQGSVLSPLLCSYLYGDLEKNHLSQFPGTGTLSGSSFSSSEGSGKQNWDYSTESSSGSFSMQPSTSSERCHSISSFAPEYITPIKVNGSSGNLSHEGHLHEVKNDQITSLHQPVDHHHSIPINADLSEKSYRQQALEKCPELFHQSAPNASPVFQSPVRKTPGPSPHSLPSHTKNCEPSDEIKHGVLVRLIDDFLYLTTDKSAAEVFVKSMHDGFGEYGIKINKSKTQVNFDLQINNGIYQKTDQIEWCGYRIDCKHLHFKKSFSRYSSGFEDLLSKKMTNPGMYLANKLKARLSVHMTPLLLDCVVNNDFVACLNVYQCFLLLAIQLYYHINDTPTLPSAEFILHIIEDVIGYMFIVISTRWINRIHKLKSRCRVTKQKVHYLGLKAFYRILSQRRSKFSDVLKQLKYHLDQAYVSKRNDDLKATTRDVHNQCVLKLFPKQQRKAKKTSKHSKDEIPNSGDQIPPNSIYTSS